MTGPRRPEMFPLAAVSGRPIRAGHWNHLWEWAEYHQKHPWVHVQPTSTDLGTPAAPAGGVGSRVVTADDLAGQVLVGGWTTAKDWLGGDGTRFSKVVAPARGLYWVVAQRETFADVSTIVGDPFEGLSLRVNGAPVVAGQAIRPGQEGGSLQGGMCAGVLVGLDAGDMVEVVDEIITGQPSPGTTDHAWPLTTAGTVMVAAWRVGDHPDDYEGGSHTVWPGGHSSPGGVIDPGDLDAFRSMALALEQRPAWVIEGASEITAGATATYPFPDGATPTYEVDTGSILVTTGAGATARTVASCPATGFWLVSLAVETPWGRNNAASVGGLVCYINVNGVTVTQQGCEDRAGKTDEAAEAFTARAQLVALVHLNAGDTVEALCYRGGGSFPMPLRSRFSGVWVGADGTRPTVPTRPTSAPGDVIDAAAWQALSDAFVVAATPHLAVLRTNAYSASGAAASDLFTASGSGDEEFQFTATNSTIEGDSTGSMITTTGGGLRIVTMPAGDGLWLVGTRFDAYDSTGTSGSIESMFHTRSWGVASTKRANSSGGSTWDNSYVGAPSWVARSRRCYTGALVNSAGSIEYNEPWLNNLVNTPRIAARTWAVRIGDG